MTETENSVLRTAKRTVVAVIGGTLIAVGTAMLVLPGPGILIAGAGVSVLATEFVWARSLMRKARDMVQGSSAPKEPHTGDK